MRNCSNSGEISQKLENWSSHKTTKSDRIEKSNKIAKVGQNWKIGKKLKSRNFNSLAGFDGNDGENADKFQETSLQKHYHKR